MANESPDIIPTEGVSKKLKVFVLILTAVTLAAFVALFTKLIAKSSIPKKTEIEGPVSSPDLIAEYHAVGTRLMNAGLAVQAIDQFIKVWELQKVQSTDRAKAAQTVGELYAKLGNCEEALLWFFRAEVSDSTLPIQPMIDSCLAKIRSTHPGQ